MTKRDRELEAGARAHFEDPQYYAQSYATRKDDVAYYTRVAKKHDRVLEYGIGSGRIALPSRGAEPRWWASTSRARCSPTCARG